MEQNKKPRGVAGVVRELCEPLIAEQSLILWDVEFVREGADMVLRITIDPLLDEAAPIESSYRLEGSSPGIERTLTRPEHFRAMQGSEVEVKLYAPIDGVKAFRAILASSDDDSVTFSVGDETLTLGRDKLARVKTVYDF